MTSENPALTPNEENIISAAESETIACGYCTKDNTIHDNFCMYCGYPLKGTEQDQKNFLANISSSKIDLEEAGKAIRTARNYVYALAGFTLLSGVVVFFMQDDSAVLIVNAILSLIYGALGYWANKKAFAAILTALILYVTVNLLNAFVEPTTLLKGLILKGVIIGLLIKGVRSAKEAEKITKRIHPDA